MVSGGSGHVEVLDELAEVASEGAARVDPPDRLPLVADGTDPLGDGTLPLLLHLQFHHVAGANRERREEQMGVTDLHRGAVAALEGDEERRHGHRLDRSPLPS